jgi:hypothetical protein
MPPRGEQGDMTRELLPELPARLDQAAYQRIDHLGLKQRALPLSDTRLSQ